MKKTLTIYFLILSSLFLTSCGSSVDSFFEDIKNNEIKRVKQVKELVNQGANIHYKDRGGNSLLHVVGNVELAEFFLEQGLDIEAKNKKWETPLYTVVERGYYDVALFLKNKGAYVYAQTNNEKNPYDLVIQLILHENLSPEEYKQLEEIADQAMREIGIHN